VAPGMKPQEVSNALWGYATLGRMPADETWAALEAAVGRVARDMTSQGLANTLYGYATLSTLRNAAPPSCYAAVWDRVSGLEARLQPRGTVHALPRAPPLMPVAR
jgi:hypothetical protein